MVALVVALASLTINFGLIDLIDGYTGYVDQARNQVLDAGWGLVFGVIVPVGLLAQLRRPQNVNDVPSMIDLKESGDIEAHAHVVLLLHTPTGPDGKPTGEDTIIIGKNRNGVREPLPVMFDQRKLRFYPREVHK